MSELDQDVKELLQRINDSINNLKEAEETVVEAVKLLQKHMNDPYAHQNSIKQQIVDSE